MFYVKGKSFLLSFSTERAPTASNQDIETTEELLDSDREDKNLAQDSHQFLHLFKNLTLLLLIALSMSAISYLYTLLLFPAVLTMTLSSRQSPFGNGTAGINVPLDTGCPQLQPRASPASSVHDLRPDDIKIVAGIGDSVMAGFAAKGIQDGQFLSIDSLQEYRGVSFAMGGDPNATTVPNLIHYYSHDLYGSSVGNHLISICFGNQICPEGQYRSSSDVLNSAQSGARSLNLDHEIDYLLDELNDAYEDGTVAPTDWKLLTFFIGSNDICHACVEVTSLPVAFKVNVQAAIERIKSSVSNVLIQIVGMMRVQDIVVETTPFTNYCQPFSYINFVGHDHECECSHSDANRTIMSNLFPQYNQALEEVATMYQTNGTNDTFTVVYQPLLVDIMTFPINAISNIDCFHPSVLAHSWLSKMLWKMMFTPPQGKYETLSFDANAPIYCPTDDDRILTI